ncbi:hypothetical protein [Pedobacter sp. NJ-S-72]
MIFITAQPDHYYFLWQIQLQLFNLKKLGVAPEDIHVLIGYDAKVGLQKHFQDFIALNKDALFYTYPDKRERSFYPSSIRPHIISQHYKFVPFLEKSTIFYIDSDVLFRELPNFKELEHTDTWYISDTASYLNYQYIIQSSNENTFLSMCNIIGIKPDLVLLNNNHVGGAQYILKNLSYKFWDKIEQNCEELYDFNK